MWKEHTAQVKKIKGEGRVAEGASKKLKKMPSIKKEQMNTPDIFGTRICTQLRNVGTKTGLLKGIFSIIS